MGGIRGNDMDFLISQQDCLLCPQLAADAGFDFTVDANRAPGDQRLGRAAGRHEAQQLEEDVQFDELAVKVKTVNGQEFLRRPGL